MFKHKHNMRFKTLTIKDAVYRELLKVKNREESFSNLFSRMIKEGKSKPDLMKFAGAWKITKGEYKDVKASVADYRKSFNKSFKERLERSGRR